MIGLIVDDSQFIIAHHKRRDDFNQNKHANHFVDRAPLGFSTRLVDITVL